MSNTISTKAVENEFNQKYTWYQMLYVAANEKYLDIDKVTKTPADNFLHFCNFITEKNKIEIARINSNINK